MRFLPLLLTLVLGTCASFAQAASFDCKAAAGKIETMICANKEVSALDDQLATAYGRLPQRAHDEKGEKAMQLAWLRTRNACPDLACLSQSYAARIAELQARSASASALVGFWKKEYSCADATDMYQELCKQGVRDEFVLSIQVRGDHVCVIHLATAQMGNRVDEVDGLAPSMTGKAGANAATVHYASNWGGTGTATLRVDGNLLRWKVTAKDGGETWIPQEETLTRVPAAQRSRLPACGA